MPSVGREGGKGAKRPWKTILMAGDGRSGVRLEIILCVEVSVAVL